MQISLVWESSELYLQNHGKIINIEPSKMVLNQKLIRAKKANKQ